MTPHEHSPGLVDTFPIPCSDRPLSPSRRGGRRGPIVSATCMLLCIATSFTAFAQKPAGKPRVPPGVDPGGVAVAIIGNGVDYTRPEIAARLARDGEGEIIGWDFVDNDRRPYASCVLGSIPQRMCPTMNVIRIEVQARQHSLRVRLIPLRARAEQPQSLVEAVKMAAAVSARIVLVVTEDVMAIPRSFVVEASRRYPRLLLIADVGSLAPGGGALEVSGNLRIVRNADAHAAEAIRLASTVEDVDAATLNHTIFGGSAAPRLDELSVPSAAPSPSTRTRGSGSAPTGPPR